MKRYDESTYGDHIAEIYDDLYSECEAGSIDLLHDLAGKGCALELGIGTARVALPLHKRGVPVTGIEASGAMIDKLKAKEECAGIEVVEGSFAGFDLGTRFDLIFVVFNTFFNLLTQEEQVQCFKSVAEHLTPEGLFLVEAFVPDVNRFDKGETIMVHHVDEDTVRLSVALHDPVGQEVRSQQVLLSEGGVRLSPIKLRYAWPPELDLMARLAGLKLKHRWGTWKKGEFTGESGKHISVYEKAGY